MRSNLTLFYDKKDSINLLEDKSYLIFSNPFYQVNKFLNENNLYSRNFIENLNDLKIINNGNSYYTCTYNAESNTIYSDNYISDIFGLLHVASNNRKVDGIGLTNCNNVGVGLNNGLTSLFASEIFKRSEIYPVEKIVAKTLLLVDKEIITYGYFNNDFSVLTRYKMDIIRLKEVLDEYHNNSLKLEELINKKTELKFKIIRNDKMINEITDVIYDIENRNTILVRELFKELTNLIAYSEIDYSKKIEIIDIINNNLNNIYNIQRLEYLKEYFDDFKFMAYPKISEVKRKIR